MLGDSALAALNWVPAAREAVQGFDDTLDLKACRRLYYPSCANPPPPTAYEAIGDYGPGSAVLVVAVGYNDLACDDPPSFEQVVGRARQLGYRQIVWWTLREVDNGFAARNTVIRDGLATSKYPDVVIADWDRYTSNRPQWFVADGVHFRPIGAWAAADYLSRKMAFVERRPCPAPTSPGAAPQDPVPRPRPHRTDRRRSTRCTRSAACEPPDGRGPLGVGGDRPRRARPQRPPDPRRRPRRSVGGRQGGRLRPRRAAVAAQALRSGAAGLCVALAQEGIDLRRAGIEAPILVFSEQPPDQLPRCSPQASHRPCTRPRTSTPSQPQSHPVRRRAATCTSRSTRACNAWAPNRSTRRRCSPTFRARTDVCTDAVYTHLACADDPGAPSNAAQLAAFDAGAR